MKKIICVFILVCFSGLIWAVLSEAKVKEIPSDMACLVANHQTQKEYEEGEETVFCPDSIRYIHQAYNFFMILPRTWGEIYMQERMASDAGKMTNVSFTPFEDPATEGMVFIHLSLKSGQHQPAAGLAENEIQRLKDLGKGFKLLSKPERVEGDYEEVKFTYRTDIWSYNETHFIKNGLFLYEISFFCDTDGHYKEYYPGFEKILKAWGVVADEKTREKLENHDTNFKYLF